MGKTLAGEVVVLPFPQTNLQAGKRRPALVVAEVTGDDDILCQITRRARSDNYSVALIHPDFESGRLAEDSFIRPNRRASSTSNGCPPPTRPDILFASQGFRDVFPEN